MTLVQYFVFALLNHFSYEDKRLAQFFINIQLTHPLTSSMNDSKHAYVPKVDILENMT